MSLIWRIFASQRTTALLVLLLSLSAAIAATVPQGADALELAQAESADRLHQLAAWGLTNIFSSYWIFALFALVAGNLVAVAAAYLYRGASASRTIDPPAGAPHDRRLEAPLPEQAVETLRAAFFRRFGTPSRQKAEGARVVMAFDVGAGSAAAPLMTHVGLMLMVLGAGLFAATESERPRLISAQLEVTDSTTGTTGFFDMAEKEPFEFFQWPDQYSIVGYEANHKELGPMLLMEQKPKGQAQGMTFPIFLRAPAGFDRAHRDGPVDIKAVRMGHVPLPGSGLADSPLGALMLFGMALVGFGALYGQRARGRLWVDVEGRDVHIVGVPQSEGDPDFASRFERWVLVAEAELHPE